MIKTLNLDGLSKLQTLWAYKNKLETFSARGCSSLLHSHIYDNNLTSIDYYGCRMLAYTNIANNKLESIDLSSCRTSLIQLFCQDNNLENLSIDSFSRLEQVWAFNNNIDEIVINYGPKLKELHCYNNPNMTKIHILGADKLRNLNANDCNLNNVILSGAANTMDLFWCQNNPELKTIKLRNGQTILNFVADNGVTVSY